MPAPGSPFVDYDASQQTEAVGAVVATFVDQIGGKNATQATNANRPVLKSIVGKKSLFFSGNQWLQMPSSVSVDRQGWTVYCVYRSVDSANQMLVHVDPSVFEGGVYLASGTAINRLAETSFTPGISGSFGVNCFAMTYGPSYARAFCGSETSDGPPRSSGTVSGGFIGAYTNSPFLFLNGHIYRVLIYSGLHSNTTAQAVLTYLAGQYGSPATDEDSVWVNKGDSLTAGPDADDADGEIAAYSDWSWPHMFQRQLTSETKWWNLGVSGQLMADMAAASDVTATMTDLVHGSFYPRKFVTLLAGTNDINAGTATATICGYYDSFISNVKAVHSTAKIVGITIPARGDGSWDSAKETKRLAVNTYIRSTAAFDHVIDLAAATGFTSTASNPYYRSDLLHFSRAGKTAIAGIVHDAAVSYGYADASTVSGTATISLAPMTLAATGKVAVAGAATISIAPLTLVAAGKVGVAGVATISLAPLSLVATGAVAVTGMSVVAPAPLALVATGVVGTAPVIGTATVTLAATTLVATGAVAMRGDATIALAALSLAATGSVGLRGQASLSIGPIVLVATGVVSGTAEAIALSIVKQHLRVEDDDQDSLIRTYVAAALAAIDGPSGRLGRSITVQTIVQRFDRLEARQRLPFPPVKVIQSVSFRDQQGARVIADPTLYERSGDFIQLQLGAAWPEALVAEDCWEVTYRAGNAEIDPPVLAAVLLMVGDMFANRETVAVGSVSFKIPMSTTVEDLLAPYRVFA